MSTRTVTVQADLVTTNYLDEVTEVQSTYPGVVVTLVKRHGPAGGCPLVELTGPESMVEAALRNFWHMDEDDVALHMGRLEPAVSDEWIQRFKPEANVWNLYTEFKAERLTTDKLEDFLNDLSQSHSYLLGGEPADCVTPAEDGWNVLQVAHVGGRDWVVILGNVGP